MKNIGIYVHIPFCKKKCDYCDFISFSGAENMFQDYIEACILDIKSTAQECKELSVDTVYFGGGTPSYIESQNIVRILEEIRKNFLVLDNAEITIELNPGTVNYQKLVDYKNAGINRLSIGLQSTHDRLLSLIGRIHQYHDFLETYQMARDIGFENINVDLMLGLPTQTLDEIVSSVREVISLKPEHISLYSFILEEGTAFFEKVKNGELELTEEKLERHMYWRTKQLLEQAGYGHYEISNFAKHGYESHHNLNCWNQHEYLGFGMAAHSYLAGKRFSRITNLEKYITNIKNNEFDKNIMIEEEQDRESKAKEYMMLGFRKLSGISISEFERKFEINPLFYFRFEISKLEEEGLIEVDLDDIRLTKKGLDLANLVFEEFV